MLFGIKYKIFCESKKAFNFVKILEDYVATAVKCHFALWKFKGGLRHPHFFTKIWQNF